MSELFARDVVAGYGPRDVLHGLDVELRGGMLVAIVGPNGAGKSTLLRVLAGLLRPTRGSVALDGAPLAGLPRREIARRIAVVPQVFETLFPLSVREVVALGRTAHLGRFGTASAADHAAIEREIGELELRPLAERPIDELSGGERQRAVVAMALAQDADVLLLDEPTVHLDPAHQRATLARLRELARGRGLAIAAVLHDLNLAALCDRVVAIADGTVVADGPPHVVVRQSTVDAVFGSGLRVLDALIPPAVVPRP